MHTCSKRDPHFLLRFYKLYNIWRHCNTSWRHLYQHLQLLAETYHILSASDLQGYIESQRKGWPAFLFHGEIMSEYKWLWKCHSGTSLFLLFCSCSFDLEVVLPKPVKSEPEKNAPQINPNPEVKMRRSKKRTKRSSVVFVDEKTAPDISISDMKCVCYWFSYTL